MILDPFHAVLGDVALGGVEDSGVEWLLAGVSGWEASASTLDVTQRAGGDGGWAAQAFFASRTLVVAGTCIAPTMGLAVDAVDRLMTAHSLGDQSFALTEATRTLRMTVRRQDQPIVSWLNDRAFDFSLQMVALDPRRFGDEQTVTTALPSSTGGLTIPFTVPFTIDAVTVTGQVSLTNAGFLPGPVVMRVDGPVDSPVIVHSGSSGVQRFAMSLSLAEGEWLDIDMDRHSVLANGQATRNGYITSRGWCQFDPGLNVWAFTAGSYSAAQLSITATPAF